MKQGSARVPDGTLSTAQREFKVWRRTRPRGSRIPSSLWQSAVDAARDHGVSRSAQALRLDYYRLKERLESAPEVAGPDPVPGGGFLEFPLFTPATSECVFALEDARGTRLRVELKGVASEELEALARALWNIAR